MILQKIKAVFWALALSGCFVAYGEFDMDDNMHEKGIDGIVAVNGLASLLAFSLW